MVNDFDEQRLAIRLCFENGKTATETLNLIKDEYGENAMSRSQLYDWYARFKTGRESTKDNPRSGRPSTVRVPQIVDSIRELLESSDRKPSLREVAAKFNISYGSCQRICEDLYNSEKTWVSSEPASDDDETQEYLVTCDHDSKGNPVVTSSNEIADNNLENTVESLKIKLKLVSNTNMSSSPDTVSKHM